MPKITVSDEVLKLIRAQAQNADESVDDILRRLLEGAADRDARLRAYEQSEQDITSTN